MDATELHQLILGLTEPWYVTTVTVDKSTTTVTIQLAHQAGNELFLCPGCQQNALVYDHLVRTDLATFGYVLIHHAGVSLRAARRLSALWRAHRARAVGRTERAFTALFESYAIDVLLTVQVPQPCRCVVALES